MNWETFAYKNNLIIKIKQFGRGRILSYSYIFLIIEIFLLFQHDLPTITNLNHKSDTQATDLLTTIHQQFIKPYLYDGRKKLLKKIQEHRRLSKSSQDFHSLLGFLIWPTGPSQHAMRSVLWTAGILTDRMQITTATTTTKKQ